MYGTTTLYHLSSDAFTKVGLKGSHWEGATKGMKQQSVRRRFFSFSAFYPHPLPGSWRAPLLCNLPLSDLWLNLPLSGLMVSTPVFWPGEFHGLYSPRGHKESDMTEWLSLRASFVTQLVKNLPATQETWVWSLVQEYPLEKKMEMHSSILAWEIPWTEEPGRHSSWVHLAVKPHYSYIIHKLSICQQFQKFIYIKYKAQISQSFEAVNWMFFLCT